MQRVLLALLLAWATTAAARPGPSKQLAWAYKALEGGTRLPTGDAPARLLLVETSVTPHGKAGDFRVRSRLLVQILTSAGREQSIQPITYSDSHRLLGFRAWTIRPDGSSQEFDRSRLVDVGLSTYHEYSDARQLILPLPNVGVGSAVAVEYVIERKEPVLQDIWRAQRGYPVSRARFIVELPADWQYETTFLNLPPTEPAREGNRLTWEFRDLPGLEGSSLSVPWRDAAATLAITFVPPALRGKAEVFREWSDVASWYAEIVSPQARADEEIRRTVARLVDGLDEPVERIRTIGRYVQDLRYISVAFGVQAFTPHPSPDVYRNRYGDCKDKATLMMTMLREAGIESHPVLVDTRRQGKVFPQFPSPFQFNHAILAIPVDERAGLAPVAIHPALGPLLMFDPTDDQTPLGDLPWNDQGTRGLLVHREVGSLVDLPVLSASRSGAERDWELQVESTGRALVELHATFTGQYARMMRGSFSGLAVAAQREAVERSFAGRTPGTRILEVTFENLGDPDRPVGLAVRGEVQRFGRRAGNLRILRPLAFLGSLAPSLPADPGGSPVLLPFHFTEHDRMRLQLPSGWRVPEPPEGIRRESAIGHMALTFERTEAGEWTLERRLELDALEIPLDGYEDARSFLAQVAGSTETRLLVDRDGP